MSSMEKNIIHDHMYLSNKDSNSLEIHRRRIHKKCDIETEEDHEEYSRRRTLNNTSCRISRIHRRSKLDFTMKKCIEYEDLNAKLTCQILRITQIIDLLKEHLRNFVPKNFTTK